jgi:RNA polymerase sigma-70 factor (ECF subfamily)
MGPPVLLGGVHATRRVEVVPADLVGLAERLRAGDAAAERELLERYGRGVRFMVRDDDLFQECFRRALEKIRAGELRDPQRLSGFIAGLARNLVLEHRRGWARQAARTDAGADPGQAGAAATQLDELVRKEQAARAREILGSLPSERDREVLRRFYLEEEPKEDICARLGVSSLHFNQILFRARERFRTLFEKEMS